MGVFHHMKESFYTRLFGDLGELIQFMLGLSVFVLVIIAPLRIYRVVRGGTSHRSSIADVAESTSVLPYVENLQK
jgi:hypothetical protein